MADRVAAPRVGPPELTPTDFSITGAERPEVRAFRDRILGAGTGTLVDVRSPEEFSGEKIAPDHLPQEQPYVAGHVPGAKNIPWGKAANEDGTFKSVEELRELYEGAGVTGGEIIAYCRIGERSSHTWFVLHGAARARGRQELRRVVDRVRIAGQCPGGEGLSRSGEWERRLKPPRHR